MIEEQVFIDCAACRAQVWLRLSAENLDIRFCPKCGAAVKPVRGNRAMPDAASPEPAPPTAVKPLAPQLLPAAGNEPKPFAGFRPIPPKTLGSALPSVNLNPAQPAKPPTNPPVADPSQCIQAAPIAFVPMPPDEEPPLPAIVLEDEEAELPRFDLGTHAAEVPTFDFREDQRRDPPASEPDTSAPFALKPDVEGAEPRSEQVTSTPTSAPRSRPARPTADLPLAMRDEGPSKRLPAPVDAADVAREARKKSRRLEKSLRDRPLWDGIYTFPFRLDNLRIVILLLISFTFMALIGCGMHALVSLMLKQSPASEMPGLGTLMDRAALYVFLCLFVLAVFVSLHQAAIFLRVVEETSAGIDEVTWPKDPWTDYLGKALFLGWVCLMSCGVWGLLLLPVFQVLPLSRVVGWILVLLFGWFTFPIVLLSTMSASAFWMVLHPPLIWRMIQKPLPILFLFGNAMLFLFPAAIVGYGVIGEYHFILLPFLAPIWTLSALVYGRVLGRVGFELIKEDSRRLRIQT